MATKQELLDEIKKEYGSDSESLLADLAEHKESEKKKAITKTNAPILMSLDRVTKKYKMGSTTVEALKDVSFNIHEGEIVALVGPSGSGKSSVLNIVSGLDKPTSGTITIDGVELGTMSDKQLSCFRNQTIGFVFQFFYLQPFLDLRANIEIPMMFARTDDKTMQEQSKALIEAVALTERANHLPKELSGGQIQRTAIARALVNNPKLLLADEPTGNLDRKNGQQVVELFEEIRRKFNTAILIVTHDEKVAKRADRIIKLEDGVVL